MVGAQLLLVTNEKSRGKFSINVSQNKCININIMRIRRQNDLFLK